MYKMYKRVKEILKIVTEMFAMLPNIMTFLTGMFDYLKGVGNKIDTLLIKMDELIKICKDKKIVIEKVEVPVEVPCCYDVEDVTLHTAKPSYYASIWENIIGQTAGGHYDGIRAEGRVKAFHFYNSTGLYVKMTATQKRPYGQPNIERPDFFDVVIAPNGTVTKNLPEPYVISDYQGSSNLGFKVSFYSDADLTQPAPLTQGLVEVAVIAFSKCKPTTTLPDFGSGTLSGGIGGNLLNAWANG